MIPIIIAGLAGGLLGGGLTKLGFDAYQKSRCTCARCNQEMSKSASFTCSECGDTLCQPHAYVVKHPNASLLTNHTDPIVCEACFPKAVEKVNNRIVEVANPCQCCESWTLKQNLVACPECGEFTCSSCMEFSDTVDCYDERHDKKVVIVKGLRVCSKCLPKVNAVVAERQKTFDRAQDDNVVEFFPKTYNGHRIPKLNTEICSGKHESFEMCRAELRFMALERGCHVVISGVDTKIPQITGNRYWNLWETKGVI